VRVFFTSEEKKKGDKDLIRFCEVVMSGVSCRECVRVGFTSEEKKKGDKDLIRFCEVFSMMGRKWKVYPIFFSFLLKVF